MLELRREDSPSLYFIVLPITLLLFYFYCRYKLNYWTKRGVQQLCNTNKIFGDFKNAILFRTPPGYHLGDIYREAPSETPYVGFYIFHKPCLLLKDPTLIKQILIRDFANFSDRHFAGSQQKDSFGMMNLFGLKNSAWRYLRNKITPTLAVNKLKRMLPLIMESGNVMIDYLKHNIDNGGGVHVFDVQDINDKFAADIIANVALGAKTDSFNYPDSDYTRFVLKFFHSLKRMVALVTVFFLPELVEMIGPSMLLNASFIRKIFWSSVESREISRGERGDYIDTIIKLKNGEQNPLYEFDGDNLLYQSGMFFSGFESSSSLSTFTLMELANNEEVQTRARKNIKNAVSIHGWTIEAFNKMKYLDQCIAEGARMHPPVPIIDRQTLQDYKIPNTDIIIEKGTPIYVSVKGLHADPQFFDEPDVFNPERFNDQRILSDAFIPYGAGPRKCIGMKTGQLQVKVVLSMILLQYKVYQKPAEICKLDSRSTFTAASADGVRIEFTKLCT